MKNFRLSVLIFSIVSLLSASPVAKANSEGMPSMPLIKPSRTLTVGHEDDLDSQKGFGDQEPMVRMMNLMMVEGSGMEGMSMDMKVNQKVAANDKATTGDSSVGNLKLGEAPKTMGSTGAYSAELKSSATAKVGTNAIQFTVTDAKRNKPAKGLKLKSQVSMTSMDMGTETPSIKEKSPGLYEVKAGFAMKGPWAVKIIFPGQQEKVFNFDVQSAK